MLNPQLGVCIQRQSHFCNSDLHRKYSCRGTSLLKSILYKKLFTLELLMLISLNLASIEEPLTEKLFSMQY